MLPATEAIAPSQVLPGLSVGAILCRPQARPIIGRRVARPHHEKQEHQQRRPVGLLAQRGQGDQRKTGVEQAEDRGRRVGDHFLNRLEEGAIDQQAQAQNAEERGRQVGPLESCTANSARSATMVAMRGGFAPQRRLRPIYSHPASAATAATASVNSHCHRARETPEPGQSESEPAAVRTRFIQG